jgi:hypothetical protein
LKSVATWPEKLILLQSGRAASRRNVDSRMPTPGGCGRQEEVAMVAREEGSVSATAPRNTPRKARSTGCEAKLRPDFTIQCAPPQLRRKA